MLLNIDEALEEILPEVNKPARYTGGELNAILKPFKAGRTRFALAFPDTYEIGMSNLAIQILYHALNLRDDCACERVFAPWPDMEVKMRERGVPLYSIESRIPIKDFDIVGFSLSYEMSFTNVLNMIDLAGIPVRSIDRQSGEYPILIAGGHCTCNPEPIAPFLDAFVIGEGEEIIQEIVDLVRSDKDLPRDEFLLRLANLEGVYVPCFYEADDNGAVRPIRDDVPAVINRRIIADVNSLPYPDKPIVPFIEVVHDRILLEVMRGCTRGCRFCQAGMITRPVREKSPAVLMEHARALVESTGHEEISLISLSTADHSDINEIVHGLLNEHEGDRVSIALPSLRADTQCVALLEEVQRVRKSGLTFAPEAGTQRMRNVINKNVTEEDLINAVTAALSAGWKRVKLYFMIGLPGEIDIDVIGIAELATKIARLARSMKISGFAIGISVSPFIPKPNTPFQWEQMDSLEEIERKMGLVRQNIGDKAVSFRSHDPRTTHVEGILAKADRRMADVIEQVWHEGKGFDAWSEYFRYDLWMKALGDYHIDAEKDAELLSDPTGNLPWDHISYGVNKAYLRTEAQRAHEEKTTGDCHTGECTHCHACIRHGQ